MPNTPRLIARPHRGARRAWVVAVGLGCAALLLAACTSAHSDPVAIVDPLTGPINPNTSYSFLSSPDFLNADIGDASVSRFYRTGSPNSTTPELDKALDTVLDKMASENVRDVYVAGDLVEGRWGKDSADTGTFGPTATRSQRRQAIRRAGDVYYQAWLDRFRARGLRTFPAVGDHDIGDNDWGLGNGAYSRFKQHNLEVWKSTYARNITHRPDGVIRFPNRPDGPAHNTAYAVRPDPEVQLVSVDVFERTADSVEFRLDAKQLDWLTGVLDQAVEDGVDWIIVQGHTPIVTPVRMIGSSGLMYQDGVDSPFWRVMKEHGVDLYLCGEVHATSMHHVDGITQVCHGGLFAYGFSNYVRADIAGGTLTMTSKRFRGDVDKSQLLWQTDVQRSMPSRLFYEPEPVVRGTLTLTSDNRVTGSSGLLKEYVP